LASGGANNILFIILRTGDYDLDILTPVKVIVGKWRYYTYDILFFIPRTGDCELDILIPVKVIVGKWRHYTNDILFFIPHTVHVTAP